MLKEFAGRKRMTAQLLAMVVLLLGAAVWPSSLQAQDAGTAGDSWVRSEFKVLGARSVLASGQIGGDGISDEFGGGAAAREEEETKVEGPSNTGDKVKAGLLSAVLPGAGQFYNGQKS